MHLLDVANFENDVRRRGQTHGRRHDDVSRYNDTSRHVMRTENEDNTQHVELQRQSLVENLIGMGFPIDWALRAVVSAMVCVCVLCVLCVCVCVCVCLNMRCTYSTPVSYHKLPCSQSLRRSCIMCACHYATILKTFSKFSKYFSSSYLSNYSVYSYLTS